MTVTKLTGIIHEVSYAPNDLILHLRDTHGDRLGSLTATHVQIVFANAIVIERRELPAVTSPMRGWLSAGPIDHGPTDGAIDHMAHARAHIALAEHLAAHPPSDEAQVRARLAGEIKSYAYGPMSATFSDGVRAGLLLAAEIAGKEPTS